MSIFDTKVMSFNGETAMVELLGILLSQVSDSFSMMGLLTVDEAIRRAAAVLSDVSSRRLRRRSLDRNNMIKMMKTFVYEQTKYQRT